MLRTALPFVLAAALLPAAPALAEDTRPIYTPPQAGTVPPAMDRVAWAPGQQEAYERARAGWLDECRRRIAIAYGRGHDDGVGGGLVGALFGGLIGNRIAGRNDRTFGTIAGAAVGAVAGAAIDRSESRDRPPESDYCQSYLDYYSYAGTWQQGGYGAAYPVMMVATPAPVQGVQPTPTQQECKEEVVYEDVDVPVPARRIIPRRPAPAKRIPDKRVPL